MVVSTSTTPPDRIVRPVGRRPLVVDIPRDRDRLTVSQVAALCGVSRMTVFRWYQSARVRLPALRAGYQVLVRPHDLATFLAARGITVRLVDGADDELDARLA